MDVPTNMKEVPFYICSSMTTQSLMIILESYVGGPNEPGEIPVKSQTEILFSTNHYLFFHSVGNFIIPTDELHHFSEGF
jgi:hypothetical protein